MNVFDICAIVACERPRHIDPDDGFKHAFCITHLLTQQRLWQRVVAGRR